MSRLVQRRIGTAAVSLLASCMLLAGCSSNGNGESSQSSGPQTEAGAVGIIGDQASGGTPIEGGTLSFAGYAQVASLDPTKTNPFGTTGGTEMAAIYDLLVRYDAATDAYVPQLAESLTESDDHLTWTLTLRDGVTFSDGTPLNAQAVVASTNRFNEKRGGLAQFYSIGVKSVEATDSSTVRYTMNQPWKEFPSLLTFGHGMIVAPTSDAADGTFTPIGAGPFTMESLNPGSALVLKARDDYWNGKPYLDTVKFVDIKDEQPKIDALNSGGIQMAFLRSAATVETAATKFPGYYETKSLNDVIQINQREGRPGADLRLRQAIQMAIDPEVINLRAKEDKGMPGTEIFQSWSKWHNDVEPVSVNIETATKLVEEAKADGFDGTMTYVSSQNQAAQATALAIQAMLAPVGIDVAIEYGATQTDVVKRLYIDNDFDISTGALSISDAAPSAWLFAPLNSKSTSNIIGLKDPKMDQILSEVQTAPDDTAKVTALAALQTEVNATVPFVALAAGANFVPWTDNVHGVVPSMDGIILLDKAWVE